MAKSRRMSLITGPIAPALIAMVIPSIGGVLAIMSASIIDIYFAGRLGVEAQAALSFTVPVAFLMSSMVMGLSIGTSVVAAKQLGGGRKLVVKAIAFHALTLGLLISTIAALLGWLATVPVFTLLGARGEIMDMVRHYMDLWYMGVPLIAINMNSGAILRADGDMVTPSVSLALVGAVKLLTTPLFMFVLDMGIAGAAMSTIMAFAAGCVLPFIVLLRRGRIGWPGTLNRGRASIWGRILQIAVPTSLANMLNPVAAAVLLGLLAPLGAATVAGFGVGTRIEALALIVPMALSGVIGPFVAQNFGARQTDRMLQAVAMSNRFVMLFGVGMALFLGLLARPLAGLFSDDAVVLSQAATYLWLVPLSYGAYGVIMIIAAAFNAVGNARPNLVLNVGKTLLVMIPGAILGARLGGLAGVAIAIAAANLLGGLAAYGWYRRAFISLQPGTTRQTAPGGRAEMSIETLHPEPTLPSPPRPAE